MNNKKEPFYTAILCVLCIILTILVIYRIGAEPEAEKPKETFEIVRETYPPYDPLEVIIEHEYIYKPLPVDYEVYNGEVPEDDIVLIAKTMYGEYRAENQAQRESVAWCILNRVDSPKYPNTVREVVTQQSQFSGWNSQNPVDADLYAASLKVYKLWMAEKLEGERCLPSDYLYFTGDGKVNTFTNGSFEMVP